LEQAQAHLGVPLKVLYRRWKEQDPMLPSLNTVYRFLREHELSTKTRRQLLKQPLGGATKCFEAPFVNDLWMVDFSPGPFLHPPGQAKALATQLCVIIDDHSRLIPYAGDPPPGASGQALHRPRRPFCQRSHWHRLRPFGHTLVARQALPRLVKGKSGAGLLYHSARL
jgi:hypothetical protein